MPEDDNIFKFGVLAIAGYVAYKTVGVASQEAEDFANIPQGAARAAFGPDGIGSRTFEGSADVASDTIDGAGETVNGVLAVPGNVIKSGQDAWNRVTPDVNIKKIGPLW